MMYCVSNDMYWTLIDFNDTFKNNATAIIKFNKQSFV